MIRPELLRAARRWHEALAGAAVAALGLWGALASFGIVAWLGWGVLAAGVALTVAGVQRGRFRRTEDGPGVVQVVEGRVAYFGPLTGGIADIADLSALTLDPTGTPPHWLLERDGAPPLAIPLTARGADRLFDAFATLPGIRTETLLREMRGGGDRPVTVWRARDAVRLSAVPHRLQ